MKRILLILLLLFGLPGCGREQTVNTGDSSSTQETVYHSDTPSEDCHLCGGDIENLIPSYWGHNNIALISLNTFDIKPIEINRYDGITGQLIEEYAGAVSFGEGGSIDGGFSASLLRDYDRGYADGIIDFYGDEVLSADKAAVFLCADCLNELLPQEIDRALALGLFISSQKKSVSLKSSSAVLAWEIFH